MKPIFLLLFLSSSVHASDICGEHTLRIAKKIPVATDVNYFIRPSSQREVSFASGSGNVILNVDTQKLIKVSGSVDPVESPDGKILAVPSFDDHAKGPQKSKMRFFVRTTKGFEPRYEDEKVVGTYQSIGALGTSADQQYRLLYAGDDGIYFRDYKLNSVSGTVVPASTQTKACSGKLPSDASLPMLSKNGREFSFYSNGKTFVYEMTSRVSCRQKEV
ncbi:MAG: hypothetical protein EOP06_01425, partial [Proteobacteria bacterium]